MKCELHCPLGTPDDDCPIIEMAQTAMEGRDILAHIVTRYINDTEPATAPKAGSRRPYIRDEYGRCATCENTGRTVIYEHAGTGTRSIPCPECLAGLLETVVED